MPNQTGRAEESQLPETARRLVAASEKILRERDFGATSLIQIARGAALTTGAVYSTVGSKAGLLAAIEQVTGAEVEAAVCDAMNSAPQELGGFLCSTVQSVSEIYNAHRGALRALALAARQDHAFAQRLLSVNERIVAMFVDCVVARGSGECPETQRSRSRIAFLAVTSALRDRIVFGMPWPLVSDMGTDQLCRELSAMALAYIGGASING